MGYLQARKIAKTFNPEQQRFIKTREIEMSDTPSRWLDFSSRVVDYDAHIYGNTEFYSAMVVLGSILTILGWVFSLTYPDLYYLPAAIFTGGTVIAFRVYLSSKKHGRYDLFSNCIIPLIRILKEDAAEDAQLHLTLNLTGLTDDKIENPISRITSMMDETVPRWMSGSYVDTWMSGSIDLIDRTRLEFSVRDKITKTGKIKYSKTSGKRKSGPVLKKTKAVTTITTILGLNKKNYSIDDVHALETISVDGARTNVKVKEGDKRYLVTARTVYKYVQDSRDGTATYKKIGYEQNAFDLNRLLSQVTALYQHCRMVKEVK